MRFSQSPHMEPLFVALGCRTNSRSCLALDTYFPRMPLLRSLRRCSSISNESARHFRLMILKHYTKLDANTTQVGSCVALPASRERKAESPAVAYHRPFTSRNYRLLSSRNPR